MLNLNLARPLIHQVFPNYPKEFQIDKLFGHASARTYYRVVAEGVSPLILMQMPEGLSSVSEEITNYKGPKFELPFVNIQKYLISKELPVPKIFLWDEKTGVMILEDLGDKLLEQCLLGQKAAMKTYFYKQAIDLLIQVQTKTEKSESCIAFARSFDASLLNWEFEHFWEYGVLDRFEISDPTHDHQIFSKITQKITNEILQIPNCFTHRDFQSRNLILKDYQLYLLDFQDALMGPELYDLVSLLRDSYIELPTSQVEELLDYYLEQKSKVSQKSYNPKLYHYYFHLLTLQRKLKDTGRFQYIYRVKSNPNFLPSVPSSLRYIQDAFSKLPEYEELYNCIARYIPEFK